MFIIRCFWGAGIYLSLLMSLNISGCGHSQNSARMETELPPRSRTEFSLQHNQVYAYSMLAPGANNTTIIYGRIVIDVETGVTCPELTGSDQSTVTTQPRPMFISPVQNATSFPVTVCETVLKPNVSYTNAEWGVQLAAVSLDASQVQVYGDSGCKSTHCADSIPSTDFQSLANIGAGIKTDLILHMGDYNYRGTSGSMASGIYAYDAGDGISNPDCGLTSTYYSQAAVNSPKLDVWSNWQSDFFEPAKQLLPKAPWVFARGNHELCSRAGTGWFYFMGPGSSLEGGIAQMQCPDQGDYNHPPATAEPHIAMIPPYLLSLNQLQLWVMDSANACDDHSYKPLTQQYTVQFNQLQQYAAGVNTANTKDNPATSIWMMTHRPLWGYQTAGSSLNKMLQTALSNTPAENLPASVTLSLSGHMHIFETLSFTEDKQRPAQIVIGNSGVNLSHVPNSGKFTETVDGQVAKGNALREFGFMSAKVGGDGTWTGQIIGTSSASDVLALCDSANPDNGKRVCALNNSATP